MGLPSSNGDYAAATAPHRRLAAELKNALLARRKRKGQDGFGLHIVLPGVAAAAGFEQADEQGLWRQALLRPQGAVHNRACFPVDADTLVDLRRGLPQERHRLVVSNNEARGDDVRVRRDEPAELLSPLGDVLIRGRLKVEVLQID